MFTSPASRPRLVTVMFRNPVLCTQCTVGTRHYAALRESLAAAPHDGRTGTSLCYVARPGVLWVHTKAGLWSMTHTSGPHRGPLHSPYTPGARSAQ